MKLWAKIKTFLTSRNKGSQFLRGAMILAVAGIICRVLGVIFRIPLTNIVGNFGMGLYQMVFPLYALLLIVSSAGVPVAISKMVAKANVDGDTGRSRRILVNSLVLLGAVGLVISILFMVFSGMIAKLQGNGDVGIIYIAIAPSVLLVCLISAFRGYFQGLQNMVPTATSQIIEQFVKMAIGITLAAILIGNSVVAAVFGAILAVTISEAVALVYLVIVYLHSRKKQPKRELTERSEATTSNEVRSGREAKGGHATGLSWSMMKEILRQSLPITAMASIFPLILVFDSMVIINLLKVGGETAKVATQLFGIQSGAVHTLINLPAVIGVAVATAVVPTISSLIKQNKDKELRTKSTLAIKLIFIISVFFVIFYLFFSRHIIDLLYHNAFKDNAEHFTIASNLLKIESAMIVLMCLTQVFSAMLQASDGARYPLIALAIGGAAKIAFQLIFITTPMGIYAVSISNVICFAIAAAINTFFALRRFKIKGRLSMVTLRMGILVAGFAGFALVLNLLLPDNRWWLLLAGALAGAFYVVLTICLKLFDKSEQKVFNLLGSGAQQE